MDYIIDDLLIEKWSLIGPGEVGEFEMSDIGLIDHGEDLFPVMIIVVALDL